MPVNRNPHSSWAEVYDLAYHRSFGEFYNELTIATIRVIKDRIRSSGSIVDFGAGTGRLSIPLADDGFEVTAVEPCREMLDQLKRKKRKHMKLRTVCSKMQALERCSAKRHTGTSVLGGWSTVTKITRALCCLLTIQRRRVMGLASQYAKPRLRR
jgi:precorrin-6B methylase 2